MDIENVIDWGGKGQVLHLAHANSFHPGTYKELIAHLTPHFHVFSILTRPLLPQYKVEDFNSWAPLSDDFIRIAEEQNWSNIIGLGHSFGTLITILTAIKKPELFSKLILIEPPVLPAFLYSLLEIVPYFISKNLAPPSRIALKRRHKWSSKEEAYQLWRQKKVFAKMSDDTLNALVDYGLYKDENEEYRLVFSKYWESKIYCTIPNPFKLFPKIDIPSLAIRAENTDVISEKNWEKWQRLQRNTAFEVIPDAGHLVPYEKPKIIADMITKFSKA